MDAAYRVYTMTHAKNFKDFINNNPKGILFLQMERGMGKTALSRALDQLAAGRKQTLLGDGRRDLLVRAYYIDNMVGFSSQIGRFQNKVSDVLRTDHETGGFFDTYVSAGFAHKEKAEAAAAFAVFLNEMLREYKKIRMAGQRLLFIIDGLDEAREETGGASTIFDCIPESGQLDDGVYMLLTGRPEDEVSDWVKTKYSALEKISKVIKYRASDGSNIAMLVKYLAQHIYDKHPASLSKDELKRIDIILEKGKYRFLHIKALRELVRLNSFDINIIGDNSIVSCYLDVLRGKYGNGKYFEKIHRLLLSIALLDEPATLDELAYLYDSSAPADLRFAGYLTDLRGLLTIDRTAAFATISMHGGWKNVLIANNNEMIKDIIHGWISEIDRKAERGYEKSDYPDGESYLIANLYSFVVKFHPGHTDIFNAQCIRDYCIDCARNLIFNDTSEKIVNNHSYKFHAGNEDRYRLKSYLNRIKKICADVISFILNEEETGVLYDRFIAKIRKVFHHYIDLAKCCISAYEKDLTIIDEYGNEKPDFDEEKHDISDFIFDGLFYRSKNEFYFLMESIDLFIDFMERLHAAGKLSDERALAEDYLYRGETFYWMAVYDRAVRDFDSYIAIIKRVYNIDDPSENQDLAYVYRKRDNAAAYAADARALQKK